jgi:hypothetical protein
VRGSKDEVRGSEGEVRGKFMKWRSVVFETVKV